MREIPREQILRRLAAENPWWEAPHQVSSLYREWRPRPYLELFYPLVAESEVRRAVVLMGPRRVGKTVMIHHAIARLLERKVPPQSIGYVSVDHPLYNGLGLEELFQLFAEATQADVRERPAYLFFDEVQYLRDWEAHLKSLVDSYPRLRVVASGSAAAALRLRSQESGAGRFTDFLLPPLTFYEYLELLEEADLVQAHRPSPNIGRLNQRFVDYLNFGGYPEALFSKEIQADPGRFIKSDIIDKVLLRDLPSLYGIQDVQELNSLFTTLAYNTAGEVSLDELSKGSGVAKNTLKRYIEYLEAAFLIRVVHRVRRNAQRFQRATHFKVYLTNPSMRAALFAPLLPDDPAMGHLVETGLFSQWAHGDQRIHYARWNRGEVDLVVFGQAGRVEEATEVKWSDRVVVHPEELAGLIDFCRRRPELGWAQVTTRSVLDVEEIGGVTVLFQPAAEVCYEVGFTQVTGKVRRGLRELSQIVRTRPRGPRGKSTGGDSLPPGED